MAAAAALIREDVWRRLPHEEAEIWFEATAEGDRKMGQAIEAGAWLGEASVAPGWCAPVEDA